MRAGFAIGAAGLLSLSALTAATQTIATTFDNQPALGAPLTRVGATSIYWPWSVIEWSARWKHAYPREFAVAELVLVSGLVCSMIAAALIMRGAPPRLRNHGPDGWARFDDVREVGLFATHGAVLGKFAGEIMVYDGPGHLLLIGASRSGKGRGHVVPTLLAWPASALVLDVKGELAEGDTRHGFPGTAGFRETLGPVLRFAPTRAASARFNPLFEVRRGANEVRDAPRPNAAGQPARTGRVKGSSLDVAEHAGTGRRCCMRTFMRTLPTMPFDAGPPREPIDGRGPFRTEPRTAQDWLDLALRILFGVPVLALYTWWVVTTIWSALSRLF